MDREKRLTQLREQIEIKKKNISKEIENENLIPAMWSLSSLIDLKAQENILKELED